MDHAAEPLNLDSGARTAPVVVPVIMAGGSGTRLWPLSRELYPKQFLPLLSERSLLQDTLRRAARIAGAAPPLIVGAEAHRFLIQEQLEQTGVSGATVMLEPESRSTAPVAAVAAHFVAQQYGPDAVAFLLSADHTFRDEQRFVEAVNTGAALAAGGRIVTFGIKPTRAETGFGYLRAGASIDGAVCEVAAFVEKPDAEQAQEFLDDGGYSWNGGMFMFRADRFLSALAALEPEMCELTRTALADAQRQGSVLRLAAEPFRACRKDSIDYAVMEKTEGLAMVPMDAGWDDVGCWTFLGELPETDAQHNHARGDVLLQDAAGNLVHAGSRLVALLGVQNHVVVETDDAVLVAPRERAQDVKQLVTELKQARRSEADSHRRVYRPWGFYETIAQGERFQVKRISVKPGHKLSLQMHHHRAEHWVIVHGTARVTVGEREFLLSEDQSTYIPLGNVHRLENPGKVPLELIEVQSGAYLGEDDIVRLDDVYGRAPAAAEMTIQADAGNGAGEPDAAAELAALGEGRVGGRVPTAH
jgi:mannose-1-phosphate guanylyltransferase/mannose-6-phosphate isomerase